MLKKERQCNEMWKHKQEEDGATHPKTQMTQPTTDNTKAIKPKGNPSKKPNGLQPPIFFW